MRKPTHTIGIRLKGGLYNGKPPATYKTATIDYQIRHILNQLEEEHLERECYESRLQFSYMRIG